MKLRISNARIVDPATRTDKVGDLCIADGRIVSAGVPADGFNADRVLNARGLVAMPGIVDLAVRMREPGEEFKASIASESRAAAAAGVTTLCCPPDTTPCVDSPAQVKMIQQRVESEGRCRAVLLGALSAGLRGEELSEMAALKRHGCVGVSNALKPVSSTLFLRRAMEYAASHGLTVFLHPLDFPLANHGCAHEGAVATRLGLPGIPIAAETAALAQQLALVEQMQVRTHFCRISSARAVEMIARALSEGLPVSADVCAHQLFLTEWDIGDYNSLCHTLPPLRTYEDREALRKALQSGAVHALCSDHQPHEDDAKQAPFPATEPGISSIETLLPLALRLVQDGALTLMQAVERLTLGPARVLGLAAGTLASGAMADICLFDPSRQFVLRREDMRSRGKNTPFAGWEFQGRVTHTLLGGHFVFESESGHDQQLRLSA